MLTVDGKTLITYHESEPFPINFFRFATEKNDDGVHFYYNCTSNLNIDPMNGVTSQANIQNTDFRGHLVALTTVMALIAFRSRIS